MNLLRIPRTVQNIQRFRQITGVVFDNGFDEFLARAGIANRAWIRILRRRRGREVEQISLPVRFVQMLEQLGAAFVKFGQVLSTRPDLLPAEWIQALKRLQDEVAPVPFERLRPAVERATGPISDAFASFDTQPLAAASVSQVHAAVLPDGQPVVVKIVRPGIRETVANDVDLMRIMAELLEQRLPELRALRPTGIVDEFERAITRELDLRHEARNLARFAHNFADNERVVVPGVYRELGNADVLIMDRIEGVRVTDCAEVGSDPKELAALGIDMLMQMIFEHGFFHADPHPGNVWALPGNRLALLDMGMADIVLPQTRDLLIDLMVAVTQDQPEQLATVVRRLGEAPESLDEARFRRDLATLYEAHVRGVRMSELSVGELIADSIAVARRHRIVIPADITLLLKAVGTVEGVGKQLDPELDIVEVARPWATKLIMQRWGPERLGRELVSALADAYGLAVSLPGRIDGLLAQAEQGRLRQRVEVEALQRSVERIEASGNRQALALLVLALTVAGVALLEVPLLQWQGWPLGTVVMLGGAAFLGSTLAVGTWWSARRR